MVAVTRQVMKRIVVIDFMFRPLYYLCAINRELRRTAAPQLVMSSIKVLSVAS
jgi:hypothetical protein